MSFQISIQLRDTHIPCANEDEANDKFADVIREFQALGIPDKKMIIRKELHQDCNLGHTHNDTIEQFPENQEP